MSEEVSAIEQIDNAVDELMRANAELRMTDAILSVMAQRPDLARRYRKEMQELGRTPRGEARLCEILSRLQRVGRSAYHFVQRGD